MTISLPSYCSRSFFALVACAVFVIAAGGLYSARGANLNQAPVLISDSTSTRAIALESITLKAEPFPLTSSVKFGNDTRTRICIFAQNLELLAGEGVSSFSADVQDASGKLYSFKVEYEAPVAGFPGVSMLILRLSDDIGDAGDVLLRINLHGVGSNRVRVAIGHSGGGPADDPGSVATPIVGDPTVAVPAATPNSYADPAFASGADGIRFLEQATWGPSDGDLSHVRAVGYAAWLNEHSIRRLSSAQRSLTILRFRFIRSFIRLVLQPRHVIRLRLVFGTTTLFTHYKNSSSLTLCRSLIN